MSKDCDYCSGSGCVYCRQVPEKIEAPEEVKGRKSFTPAEVKEFKFTDNESAQIMADYLNRRCSCNQSCPLIGSVCLTDCVCFEKARITQHSEPWDKDTRIGIYGFCCDNPMLKRSF